VLRAESLGLIEESSKQLAVESPEPEFQALSSKLWAISSILLILLFWLLALNAGLLALYDNKTTGQQDYRLLTTDSGPLNRKRVHPIPCFFA